MFSEDNMHALDVQSGQHAAVELIDEPHNAGPMTSKAEWLFHSAFHGGHKIGSHNSLTTPS